MNLSESKRPCLILGGGIHSAHAEQEARELVDLLQIPVVLTWAAADILPESCPYRIGTFGTHGTRAANFAVQNADFILSIGSRLDTKATGTPAKWFAREAHIVMVDIDQAEIDKMEKVGVKVTPVCMDAKRYIAQFGVGHGPCNVPEWVAKCQDWKARYPAVLPEYEKESGVNPYVLIRELSRLCEPGDIIVSDTGCALAWTAQAFEFKEGQRLLHPWNQTPMGYGLPGAIGAHYATGKRVICVTGDGSIMMSIGELATIAGHKLPIKIVLIENGGHGMCRASEREWLGGKHCATSIESGLRFPDFLSVAEGFSIPALKVRTAQEVDSLNMMLNGCDGPFLLEATIPHEYDVRPKVKAWEPNENGQPYLERDVLAREMLIPLVGEA